jgi:2,4-dienoyl-CoA reductase-like NADH-dependent reductase (Old Yellow Enzyme family)
MSELFEQVSVGEMAVPNRFVRSATFEGMAELDGSCKEVLVDLTAELAKGEVGTIIASHAFVEPRGRVRASQLGIHRDEMVPGLASMVAAAHDNGSIIIAQIAHGGCTANDPDGEPVGPSAFTRPDERISRELTTSEISQIVSDFKAAATRAMQAGFDGVQIHSAHAYLLSQFLSPFFNRRSDEYGGILRNRARIHLQVLEAVRSAVGDDVPVLIKMNSNDFVDGGFTQDEMVEVSKMLAAEGISAIEMSGGTPFSPANRGFSRPGVQDPAEEVYYLDAAKQFKDNVDVPLVLVGGIRTYAVAESLVQQGVADFISLSRPLIREPNLIRRWHEGDLTSSTCIHCNQCFGPARAGEGIYCVAEYKARQKKA